MFAASLGINVVFVTSSTILKCLPPERYYSPISNNEKLFVNPEHALVNEQALGELSINPRNYISYATLEEAQYFKALKLLASELQ